jgi:exonuclease SbcC
MRPEKLVMENFGAFSGRVELDFSRLDDIFLITGKTGAGKTTIFDALCFALYGKVPGSRGDHAARLPSDHAKDGDDCLVLLEFSLGEKRYRVERGLQRSKKKKQADASATATPLPLEQTLALCEIVNKISTNFINKKSEADAKLRELIGLEADEFFKIVLLPQGEFAEFLRQKTSERLSVLGKLFPVEKAVRVKELARKKAGDIEAQAKESALILKDLSQKLSLETYETTHAQASAAIAEAARQSQQLEREETALDRILGLWLKERDAENRLGESRKQQGELAKAEVTVNEKAAALSRSREGRPLEQFLRGLETAGRAVTAAEAALADSLAEKDAATAAAQAAQQEGLEAAALEKETQALRQKRPALAEALVEEEKLKRLHSDLQKQQAAVEKIAADKELLLQERVKNQTAIEAAQALASQRDSLEGQHRLSESVKDIFLEFRTYRGRMDSIERDRVRTEAEIRETEQQAGELDKRIPVLQAELNGLREEKIRSVRADMAGLLSAALEPGKPCPVCGSTEHPRPAAAGDSPFGMDERIGAQEASLMEAEKLKTAAAAALEAKKREAMKIGKDLELLNTEISERRRSAFPVPPQDYPPNPEAVACLRHDAPLPSAGIIENIIKTETAWLDGIQGRLRGSRDAADRITELYRAQADSQNKIAEAEKQIAAAEEQAKNIALRIAEVREKHRFLAGQSAAKALGDLDSLIEKNDNLITRRREEREQALLRLSGAQASWEGAAKHRGESVQRLAEARAALEKALASTDFANAEEAERALLDPADEEALDRDIRRWHENRAGLATRLAEQEQQLQAIRAEIAECVLPGVVQPQTLRGTEREQDARRRLEAIKAERAVAEKAKSEAITAVAGMEKDRLALLEAQKRHDELAEEARTYRALSDDLSGKNPRSLPFDSWLLGHYLEEAAAYATTRLGKMSESRYSLLLDTEGRQGRGYAGLDLMVFDAHTGKTRPCATLSGGESFMASISLALGLADSIQNRSGGVKLDAVFIDEGFGSLDETSLDKALVILDELRDHRMVGLISHVGELRSRIPCQVEVVKTSAGSHIATTG